MSQRDVAPDPAESRHLPVLCDEVIDALNIRRGALAIDATLGAGGHAARMLTASAPQGRLLGMDADPAAIRRVQKRLASQVRAGRLTLVQTFFDRLLAVATEHNYLPADAVLLDLGVSSFQLETAERGFSLMRDGPLDMRFDPEQSTSAADLVNHWPEAELADILYRFGEERRRPANCPFYRAGAAD